MPNDNAALKLIQNAASYMDDARNSIPGLVKFLGTKNTTAALKELADSDVFTEMLGEFSANFFNAAVNSVQAHSVDPSDRERAIKLVNDKMGGIVENVLEELGDIGETGKYGVQDLAWGIASYNILGSILKSAASSGKADLASLADYFGGYGSDMPSVTGTDSTVAVSPELINSRTRFTFRRVFKLFSDLESMRTKGNRFLRTIAIACTSESAPLFREAIMAVDPGFFGKTSKGIPKVYRMQVEDIIKVINKAVSILCRNIDTALDARDEIWNAINDVDPDNMAEIGKMWLGFNESEHAENYDVVVDGETKTIYLPATMFGTSTASTMGRRDKAGYISAEGLDISRMVANEGVSDGTLTISAFGYSAEVNTETDLDEYTFPRPVPVTFRQDTKASMCVLSGLVPFTYDIDGKMRQDIGISSSVVDFDFERAKRDYSDGKSVIADIAETLPIGKTSSAELHKQRAEKAIAKMSKFRVGSGDFGGFSTEEKDTITKNLMRKAEDPAFLTEMKVGADLVGKITQAYSELKATYATVFGKSAARDMMYRFPEGYITRMLTAHDSISRDDFIDGLEREYKAGLVGSWSHGSIDKMYGTLDQALTDISGYLYDTADGIQKQARDAIAQYGKGSDAVSAYMSSSGTGMDDASIDGLVDMWDQVLDMCGDIPSRNAVTALLSRALNDDENAVKGLVVASSGYGDTDLCRKVYDETRAKLDEWVSDNISIGGAQFRSLGDDADDKSVYMKLSDAINKFFDTVDSVAFGVYGGKEGKDIIADTYNDVVGESGTSALTEKSSDSFAGMKAVMDVVREVARENPDKFDVVEPSRDTRVPEGIDTTKSEPLDVAEELKEGDIPSTEQEPVNFTTMFDGGVDDYGLGLLRSMETRMANEYDTSVLTSALHLIDDSHSVIKEAMEGTSPVGGTTKLKSGMNGIVYTLISKIGNLIVGTATMRTKGDLEELKDEIGGMLSGIADKLDKNTLKIYGFDALRNTVMNKIDSLIADADSYGTNSEGMVEHSVYGLCELVDKIGELLKDEGAKATDEELLDAVHHSMKDNGSSGSTDEGTESPLDAYTRVALAPISADPYGNHQKTDDVGAVNAVNAYKDSVIKEIEKNPSLRNAAASLAKVLGRSTDNTLNPEKLEPGTLMKNAGNKFISKKDRSSLPAFLGVIDNNIMSAVVNAIIDSERRGDKEYREVRELLVNLTEGNPITVHEKTTRAIKGIGKGEAGDHDTIGASVSQSYDENGNLSDTPKKVPISTIVAKCHVTDELGDVKEDFDQEFITDFVKAVRRNVIEQLSVRAVDGTFNKGMQAQPGIYAKYGIGNQGKFAKEHKDGVAAGERELAKIREKELEKINTKIIPLADDLDVSLSKITTLFSPLAMDMGFAIENRNVSKGDGDKSKKSDSDKKDEDTSFDDVVSARKLFGSDIRPGKIGKGDIDENLYGVRGEAVDKVMKYLLDRYGFKKVLSATSAYIGGYADEMRHRGDGDLVDAFNTLYKMMWNTPESLYNGVKGVLVRSAISRLPADIKETDAKSDLDLYAKKSSDAQYSAVWDDLTAVLGSKKEISDVLKKYYDGSLKYVEPSREKAEPGLEKLKTMSAVDEGRSAERDKIKRLVSDLNDAGIKMKHDGDYTELDGIRIHDTELYDKLADLSKKRDGETGIALLKLFNEVFDKVPEKGADEKTDVEQKDETPAETETETETEPKKDGE